MSDASYRCGYCNITFTQQTPRGIVRHLQLYHAAKQKEFTTDPSKFPLICGSCKWRCDDSISNFKKHIQLHLNGKSQFMVTERRTISEHSNDVQTEIMDDEQMFDDDYPGDIVLGVGANTQHCRPNQLSDLQEDDETHNPTTDNIHTGSCDNTQSFSKIQSAASERFLLSLYTEASCTSKQIQDTVESVGILTQTSVSHLSTMLEDFIETLPSDLTTTNKSLQALREGISIHNTVFRGLGTEHHRMKYFATKGMILPRVCKIGTRLDAQPDGSQVEVDVNSQYVPVTDTLIRYYDHYIHLMDDVPEPGPTICSYLQTTRCQSDGYNLTQRSALRLILYHDDIEVANVLGSRAGVHKLTMFYYTIHGQASSRLQSIHLAIVCHATDVKQFGYHSILQPLIADLKDLAIGVLIPHKDVVLYARLEHIVGDNLAANAILGMNQSFTHGHFCRFCYIRGREAASTTDSRDQLPRCRISHQFDVEAVQNNPSHSTSTGVKEPCALDELDYFSGVESTVPDIMHDILEGIGKLEVKLIVDALIEDKLITLHEFNRRLTTLNYGRHESSNKPSTQRTTDCKQSASQMWCLIRFLPQLIGNVVPVNYPEWAVFLLLRTIMDIVFSPRVTEDSTYALEGLIEEHHDLFLKVHNGVNLTAKAHFMTHYGSCIRTHGPLVAYWCMRYESKHRLAKLVTSVSSNFRNLPVTVAKRYQLKEYADSTNITSKITTTSKGVSVLGTEYQVGDYIVVGLCDNFGFPVFGKVQSMEVLGESLVFKCALADTWFNPHYHAHELVHQTEKTVLITSCQLLYHLPASFLTTDSGLHFLCIRHNVIK